jgi:glycosyltransferase involved in cell wall biosynthesis
MKRIRILHFTKIINKNDFIDVIARNADPSRFEMFTCSYKGYSNIEEPEYEKSGIPFYSLNIEHGWIDLFKGAFRLSIHLKENKIEILHTHHYYEAIIGRLACWLYPSCKHIIGRHYHDQFYITTVGIKLKFYLLVENIVNFFSAAIIVPSTAIVDLLAKQDVNLEKVHKIPYCFDFKSSRYNRISDDEVLVLKKEIGWEGKFVIGNVGRHHSLKGQIYLLRAFKVIHRNYPDSLLAMIGDGPFHDELLREAKNSGLSDSIRFLGWRKDSHYLMNGMDVVVHPTLQEAFPQIMIETLALGKPLIITPVSGATDVIIDGENGFMIPFESIGEIVSKVTELYLNTALRDQVSHKASEFVRERYSIEKIIPDFEKVYEKVNTSNNV